jgi:hypothetical protein
MGGIGVPGERRHRIETCRSGSAEVLNRTGTEGAKVPFLFGNLITNAASYGCPEVRLAADDDRFNSRFHFGLDYRPDLATRLDGRDLPIPDGLNGSLVWILGSSNFRQMSGLGTWTARG